MTHIEAESIIHQLEETETLEESLSIAHHLERCTECGDVVQEFRGLLDVLSGDPTNEPSAEAVNWAVGLFQPVMRVTGSKTSKVLGVARLIFDSFGRPAPAGIRNAGSLSRQLLFRADDVDVDVRIDTRDEQLSLAGQVVSATRPFFENTPVRLESDGVGRYWTHTNSVGEFSFDEVPHDTYHLCVDLPEGQVTLFCVCRQEPLLA